MFARAFSYVTTQRLKACQPIHPLLQSYYFTLGFIVSALAMNFGEHKEALRPRLPGATVTRFPSFSCQGTTSVSPPMKSLHLAAWAASPGTYSMSKTQLKRARCAVGIGGQARGVQRD